MNLSELLSRVRIFASYDAGEADDRGKPISGAKPMFDNLYQRALDLRLADAVVLLSTGCPQELLSRSEVVSERAKWYPANRVSKLKGSLIQLPAREFGMSWSRLRLLAEPPSRKGSIWSNDPALIFETSPRVKLCRTACVGHEGHVFFFVYAKEREWEKTLAEAHLSLFGSGEDAYRRLVPEPGAVAG